MWYNVLNNVNFMFKWENGLIRVLDAMMGCGKTTGIFNRMRNSPEERYLYIGLFLQEVGDGNTGEEGRIQKELPELEFKMPKNVGEGKLEGLKRLVKDKENIASTHALFSMFDREVVELLVKNGYTLIIDEAIDAITTYQDVKRSDVELMMNTGVIVREEDGRIKWNGDTFTTGEYDGKFLEIRELCGLGSLYWYNDEVFIWEYPPVLLKEIKEVIIITYMFEGSIMSNWLKLNGLEYEYIDNASFGLIDNEIVMQSVRENLEVVVPKRLMKMKTSGSMLGVNWFDKKCTKEDYQEIKGIMENFVGTYRFKVGEVFWTTFLSKKSKLEGRGYTRIPKDGLSPFLPFNTKATNDYKDYKACMYACNVYKSPLETGYLKSRGIEFDQDAYALSMMVQFLWRGAIRCGKPMKVLIISERMRSLLEKWLDE